MKTFNKRGDRGETSLLYGCRVSKSDLRCEAYGTIDEAVSALGLARHFCQRVEQHILTDLQRELFKIGAELACPCEHYDKFVTGGNTISTETIERLEELINDFETRIDMPHAFVLPGGVKGSAALDLVRAIIRRAERRVTELSEKGELPNIEVAGYLNRLADLMFTLARYEEGEHRAYI